MGAINGQWNFVCMLYKFAVLVFMYSQTCESSNINEMMCPSFDKSIEMGALLFLGIWNKRKLIIPTVRKKLGICLKRRKRRTTQQYREWIDNCVTNCEWRHCNWVFFAYFAYNANRHISSKTTLIMLGWLDHHHCHSLAHLCKSWPHHALQIRNLPINCILYYFIVDGVHCSKMFLGQQLA